MADNDDKEDKITKLVKEGKLPFEAAKRKKAAAAEPQNTDLQKKVDSLAQKYGSIAGMAVDIFKNLLLNPDYKDYNHSKLVKISYDIAEEFQEELDNRYNYELFKLSRLSAKEVSDVETAQPIIRGTDDKEIN